MPDFKYTLTRFCLRSGQLTLPQRLKDLFPSAGEFSVRDTDGGEEYTLTMTPPRTVSGLGPFFAAHGLTVNDEILIRLQDDERLAFTALPRRQEAGEASPEALTARLLADGTPLSEAEIRELHPELSRGLELGPLLSSDARFELREGRWRPRAEEPEPAPEAREVPRRLRPGRGAPPKPKRASVTPYPRGVIFPGDAALNSEQESADLGQHQRLKALFSAFGFRVEGLAHRQLLAHAELGRRQFSALLHLLDEGGKVDWSALFARRRETGASYAAVFGHDLDLAPIETPAELARTSLWSFAALGRLETILELVPLSPIDLEPFLEKGGLYGKGLERFEQAVNHRIEERGLFSSVLARLAAMRAPAIFMLDDLADGELSREQALKVLELLAQAPFHLVSKVDSGEFCLRFRVSDGLVKFSDYALSLQSRLPARRTERLQGEGGQAPRELIDELAERHGEREAR